MSEKFIALELLQRIETSLIEIIDWTENIKSIDDFLFSQDGMILLNAVCMKLIVVGEDVKALDKYTHKALLKEYHSVNWKDIMGMRDVIAHHYFDLEAEKVFDTLKDDVPELINVIIKMKKDIL
jgi:uncharacterized protein with HEPN domain